MKKTMKKMVVTLAIVMGLIMSLVTPNVALADYQAQKASADAVFAAIAVSAGQQGLLCYKGADTESGVAKRLLTIDPTSTVVCCWYIYGGNDAASTNVTCYSYKGAPASKKDALSAFNTMHPNSASIINGAKRVIGVYSTGEIFTGTWQQFSTNTASSDGGNNPKDCLVENNDGSLSMMSVPNEWQMDEPYQYSYYPL